MPSHKDMTGLNLHQFVNYWQETDPGAVGYKKTWFKESTATLKFRNAANTDWTPFLSPQIVGGGTGLTNAIFVPPSGITAGIIQEAVDDSADGGTVVLPDIQFEITSPGVHINKGTDTSLTIMGAGPNCEVIDSSGVSQFGTGALFAGGVWDGITTTVMKSLAFRNFKCTTNRTAIPNSRISHLITNNVKNVIFDRMRFQDCTSSCIRAWECAESLSVTNCEADEFYEQFVELSFSAANVDVSYNRATCSSFSPAFSTKPFALIIDLEFAPGGAIRNLVAAHNDFDGTGINSTSAYGIMLSQGYAASGTWVYDNILLHHNRMRGWAQGLRIQGMNGLGAGAKSRVVVNYNWIHDCLTNPAEVILLGTETADDQLVFLNNYFKPVASEDAIKNVTATSATITEIQTQTIDPDAGEWGVIGPQGA